jgi:DNA-binding Lrp family transcriptional regulator
LRFLDYLVRRRGARKPLDGSLAATASSPPGALQRGGVFAGLRLSAVAALEARVVPFFVQIKCHLGKSYEVANKLADSEIASEIYSTAGEFDLLVKFYVEAGTDIGHFINEKVQTIAGIQDTRTIITFKAF